MGATGAEASLLRISKNTSDPSHATKANMAIFFRISTYDLEKSFCLVRALAFEERFIIVQKHQTYLTKMKKCKEMLSWIVLLGLCIVNGFRMTPSIRYDAVVCVVPCF